MSIWLWWLPVGVETAWEAAALVGRRVALADLRWPKAARKYRQTACWRCCVLRSWRLLATWVALAGWMSGEAGLRVAGWLP